MVINYPIIISCFIVLVVIYILFYYISKVQKRILMLSEREDLINKHIERNKIIRNISLIITLTIFSIMFIFNPVINNKPTNTLNDDVIDKEVNNLNVKEVKQNILKKEQKEITLDEVTEKSTESFNHMINNINKK